MQKVQIARLIQILFVTARCSYCSLRDRRSRLSIRADLEHPLDDRGHPGSFVMDFDVMVSPDLHLSENILEVFVVGVARVSFA